MSARHQSLSFSLLLCSSVMKWFVIPSGLSCVMLLSVSKMIVVGGVCRGRWGSGKWCFIYYVVDMEGEKLEMFWEEKGRVCKIRPPMLCFMCFLWNGGKFVQESFHWPEHLEELFLSNGMLFLLLSSYIEDLR